MIEKEEIEKKVICLFNEMFCRDKKKEDYYSFNNNFFGKKMELRPGDVLAFMYAIEKEFGITIPSSELISGRFNCLNNVTDIVYEVLSEQ